MTALAVPKMIAPYASGDRGFLGAGGYRNVIAAAAEARTESSSRPSTDLETGRS